MKVEAKNEEEAKHKFVELLRNNKNEINWKI